MDNVIMIVEDDIALRTEIAHFLSFNDFSVLEAGSIAEAKRLIARQKPSLVLLDLGLPDGDGQDLLALIKAHMQDVSVIVITVRDSHIELPQSIFKGADHFIEKPVDMRHLLNDVNAQLLRKSIPQKAVPVLDESSRTLVLGNNHIKLTRIEQVILKCLLEKPGQMVYYDELAEAVWHSSEGIASEATLQVHVARIRKKIGGDLISNRSGEGYVLNL